MLDKGWDLNESYILLMVFVVIHMEMVNIQICVYL